LLTPLYIPSVPQNTVLPKIINSLGLKSQRKRIRRERLKGRHGFDELTGAETERSLVSAAMFV
jgi:hypothetical protein